MSRVAWLALVVVLALPSAAWAYPQFTLSRQTTCTACHISPAGGGIVDGMGIITAEDDSTWGGDGQFFVKSLPEWLKLSGDLRSAIGANDNGGGLGPAYFPMQIDGYAAATKGPFTGYATLGLAKPNTDNLISLLQLREHWVMYRPNAEEGFYVRVGRFMPVYGLRLAEHMFYTRRYGGTALYGESYGVNAGWVSDSVEAHATAFLDDPIGHSTEKESGVAMYVEKRLGERAAIGAQARYANGDLQGRGQGGLTAKLWIPEANLLLMGEGGFTRQSFEAGPSRNQVLWQVLGSWFFRKGFLLDAGVGRFNADTSLDGQDRTSLDMNLHWFIYAHMEVVLMTRLQVMSGGPESGWTLLQAHYRL